MPRSIECHYTGCREIFKPRGNQRYHSEQCARKGRRLQDRLRKRRQRSRQTRLKIEQNVQALQNRPAAQSEKNPPHLSAVHPAGEIFLSLRHM